MNTIRDIEDLIRNTIKNTEWENIVYAAGGYVRDQIMGKEPHDLDLLIDKPNGGVEFTDWIVNTVKIGKDACLFPRFGTAKFSINGFDIEAVMPRGEHYTQGSRKPEVYSVTLREDALRRDLTINALFKNISTGEILDFTGKGLDDIRNNIIRTPLDPNITFSDDPLRMLRVCRFWLKFNAELDVQTIQALKDNVEKLKNISAERITDEFNKIIVLNNPNECIRKLRIVGLLKYIIPELEESVGVTQNHHHCMDVFDHILEVTKNTRPILKHRLMALFHDIAKPRCKTDDETGIRFSKHEDESAKIAKEIMIRMKYPNDMIDSVILGISSHMRIKSSKDSGLDITDKALRRFKFDMGEDLEDILDLIHADNISHAEKSCMPNQVENIRKRIALLNIEVSKPKLPINGHEIMNIFNIAPGKLIGTLLKEIEDLYLENPNISKEECISFINYYLKKDN